MYWCCFVVLFVVVVTSPALFADTMDKWIFAVAVTLAVIHVASSDTLKPTGQSNFTTCSPRKQNIQIQTNHITDGGDLTTTSVDVRRVFEVPKKGGPF